jgi:4-carboxymuconolactone decarboxylase
MERDELRRQGEAMRERLGLPAGSVELVPGMTDFIDETAFGGIWSRPGLAPADRMVVTLSVLAQLQRLDPLRTYIGAALALDLKPRAIQEVLFQCGLYGGVPVALAALQVAAEVFTSLSIEVPAEDWEAVSLEELERRGQETLDRLHGARGREGYAAPDNRATEALYEIAIQYGYGEIWSRPGLDWRGRMLCALASFTVMRLDATLAKFAQSALNVGLSREEVIEAIMQTAAYGGFPVALSALNTVGKIL